MNHKAVVVCGCMVLAIIYGSLYPFDFVYANPYADQPLAALFASWRRPLELTDVIANILFYTPLGFFAARSVASHGRLTSITIAAAAGTALSLTMELAQFYTVDRYTSFADLCANAIGSILGASYAGLFRRRFLQPLHIAHRAFVFVLLVAWCGWQSFPFVPAADVHKYLSALKPVVVARNLSLADICYEAATWLAVGFLLEQLVGSRRGIWFMLTVPAVLFAHILVLGRALSASELIGAFLGPFLWLFVFSRASRPGALILVLFAAAFSIHNLEPFNLIQTAHPVDWTPFRAILNASPSDGTVSFLERVFTCGTLLWLLVNAGLRLCAALFTCVCILSAINLVQMFMPQRPAEITDILLVTALAGVMRALEGARTVPCPEELVYEQASVRMS